MTEPEPLLCQRMRDARIAAGWSQDRIAAHCHVTRMAISHYETGRRAVPDHVITGYRQALGASLTGDTWGDPIRGALDWITTAAPHPAEAHLAAGPRVGHSLIDTLTSRVADLRHADDVTPAAMLYPRIAAELDTAVKLLRDTGVTGQARTRLGTATGELGQLAGWVAADAGWTRRAEAHYRTGASAAAEVRDAATAANCWSSLAYLWTGSQNRGRDAVLLARTAMAGSAAAAPRVRALMADRVAWAAAGTGDHATMADALTRADDAIGDDTSHTPEPEWTYWVNRAELDIMAARCRIATGQPDRAIPLLTTALAGYPAEHAREVALYRSWLAEAYARTGEPEAARDALPRTDSGSARVAERADQVHQLI